MSPKNFADKLIFKIEEKNSCLVVGIDPDLDLIPASIKAKASAKGGDALKVCADAIEMFGKGLIDAVADIVPAVKPQVAFYERFGWRGFRAFCETVKYARKAGLIVIGDVKRNDIGSTVQAYADGLMGTVTWGGQEIEPVGVDALTLNAYLGTDGVQPFVDVAGACGKGVFVVVRTSNPSAPEIQDIRCGRRNVHVYEIMAELVAKWGEDLCGAKGYSSVGAVVAATYPEDAQRLRKLLPKAIFLMPGIGAQKGEVEAVGRCFDAEGHGALIAAARSIDYAFTLKPYKDKFGEDNWQQAAAEAAKKLNEEINAVRFKACRK